MRQAFLTRIGVIGSRPRRGGLFVALICMAAAALAGLAWWSMDLRWRPVRLARHEGEISAALEQSGWVSERRSGRRVLWLVRDRPCPECSEFLTQASGALRAAAVQLRVIVIPGPAPKAAERSTIAAVWATRDEALFVRWTSTPTERWTAESLPSADADPGRAAQFLRSRDVAASLIPLLRADGLDPIGPILIWRDRAGRLRGCGCASRTFRFVRAELSGR